MYENGEKIKHPKSNDVEGASGKITEQSQKLVEQMKQNYLEKLVIIQDFTKWTLPDDVMIEIRKLKN